MNKFYMNGKLIHKASDHNTKRCEVEKLVFLPHSDFERLKANPYQEHEANDPDTAKMQFESVAKYHGNDGKNQFIHFMMSFLTDTAPDADTAMKITDQALAQLKDKHLILIGNHKKHRGASDYHTHGFVGTTDLETGRMLHANNKLNYAVAQELADVIQKPVELVIEKKKPGQNASHDTDDLQKKDDFTRVFYPHKSM